MRRAGLVVWGAHEIAAAMVRPGVSTGEIDAAVEAYFLKCGAVPLFKGVPGKVPFPAVCCISVNDEVVHGIPGPRILVEGDIVSIDPSVVKALQDDQFIPVISPIGFGENNESYNINADVVAGKLATVLKAGGGLSAGEAQLLAFARVFLKDPGLVVLDEASSRLDPATDQLIEQALDRLLGTDGSGRRRTAIIIAHKLSTVQRADRIAILDQGRLLETGRRTDLEADPTSAYARLLRTGLEEVMA